MTSVHMDIIRWLVITAKTWIQQIVELLTNCSDATSKLSISQRRKPTRFTILSCNIFSVFKKNTKNHFEVMSLIDREFRGNEIKEVVKGESEKGLPNTKKRKKANWMSGQMLKMTKMRTEAKAKKDKGRGNNLIKNLRELLDETRSNFTKICKNIEDGSTHGKTGKVFQKISEGGFNFELVCQGIPMDNQ